MTSALFGSDTDLPDPVRITGVLRAVVLDNLDLTGLGRVQVRIPTLPGLEPWAEVCAPVAGSGRGVWLIPQPDDVVLVAFENGDVTQPVVLGGMWDQSSRPPADLPTDATTKRIVRSPAGHEVVLDDAEQSITLRHATGHVLEITADGIRLGLAADAASLTLNADGSAELTARTGVTVSAPSATVSADGALDLSGGTANLTADTTCGVSGRLVTIN